MLYDPRICWFLGRPLFLAVHAGLPGGIRFHSLSWSRILGLEPETDTQPPLCFLDPVVWVRRKLNSLVLNSLSGGGCLPTDSALRQLPICNPSGWLSLLFIYAVGICFRGCHHVLDRSAGHREQGACSVYRSISDRVCLYILVWPHRCVWKGLLWGDRRINLAAYSLDDWSLIWICSG